MASDFFLFTREPFVPCWHELSFCPQGPSILVKVSQDYLRNLPNGHLESGFWQILEKKFGFSNFGKDIFKGDYGFENCFKRQETEGQFLIFKAEIPTLVLPCKQCQGGNQKFFFGACPCCKGSGQEMVCRDCKGGGESWTGMGECLSCNGSGRRKQLGNDWKKFHAISATFSVFFKLMFCGIDKDKSTPSPLPQLFTVETITEKGLHGGSLGGQYSPSLVGWLSSFPPETELKEVIRAIKATHKRIFGEPPDKFDMHDISARTGNKGWLCIGCKGDRTGLHPETHFSVIEGEGYRFSCHNVDTPMQQLCLLSGLAALHDKARKEMKF